MNSLREKRLFERYLYWSKKLSKQDKRDKKHLWRLLVKRNKMIENLFKND